MAEEAEEVNGQLSPEEEAEGLKAKANDLFKGKKP